MLNYIKSFFQRKSEVPTMKKMKVTYTVQTEVTFNDVGDWTRKVRAIRKAIKTLMVDKDVKILRIEHKQEG